MKFTFLYILSLVLFSSCTSQWKDTPEERCFQRQVDGVAYEVFYRSDSDLNEALLAKVLFLHEVFNDYDQKSEIWAINELANKEAVKVSPEMASFLSFCETMTKKTKGSFDISLGRLIRLWKMAKHTKILPRDKDLLRAMKSSTWEQVDWDAEQEKISFKSKGMRLELGGVSQGYFVDELADYLRSQQVSEFRIDLSGDLFFSKRLDDQLNVVTVDSGLEGAPRGELSFTKGAITTSSAAFNGFVIDGEHYSHAINARTGRPSSGEVVVSVFAPSAREADAWATALSVLGVEMGLSLLLKQEGIEAMFFSREQGVWRIESSPSFPVFKILE